MTDFSINQLSALSGLSVRTIRYYLSQGLIPSAGREGPSTRYPESTLARLRLIRKLQASNHSLAEIRHRLAGLSDEDAIALAGAPEAPAPEGSALDYVRSLLGGEAAPNVPAPGAPVPHPPKLQPLAPAPPRAPMPASMSYVLDRSEQADQQQADPQQAVGDRSQWERISLGPDIELHVRRPLSRRDNRTVDRLIAFARQLQEEEAP